MSEFRLTVTPRTDLKASAAPSSGSSVRAAQPAFQSGPTGPTGPGKMPHRGPALQSVVERQSPALQCMMRQADAA